MRNFKLLVIVAAVAIGIISTTAIALAAWCWSDPVIGIQAPGKAERDLTIDVAIDSADIAKLDGPVAITVKVPSNVNARVKLMDNVIPESVTILKTGSAWDSGSIRVDTTIRANASSDFAIQAQFEYINGYGNAVTQLITGSSNQDLTFRAYMKP